MSVFVLQTRKTGALASEMAASATSCTLAGATFGTPTGQQIITIDGGDILKAADFKCTIAGTAVSAMTLLNGVDVVHAAAAPVTMNFVDEHYSALTAFVGARAYLNATLGTTVSGVITKVALDNESYDVGANFASNKFVAPVNGYYSINANVTFTNAAAAKRYAALVYKNGASIAFGRSQSGVADQLTAGVSDTVYLAATDYIELYYYHDDATTTDVNGGIDTTFLAVHLIKEV